MASSVRQFRFLARGSARTSAHQSSPVGSCGGDHDRRPTASRACSMAVSRCAISGRPVSSSTKFRMRQVARRILWRHERRSNVRSLSTWGSRQVELAILQAVAGHRQVLPTHHTARKIISEPKKSHSRSGFVKKLTHRIACRGGDIPTVVDGRVQGPEL
jgi:hypothetical protein